MAISIVELEKRLIEAKIPHELTSLFDGYKISYPNDEDWIGDVVCHSFSLGYETGLMEAYGFDIPNNDVRGYLTVEDAFGYFQKAYSGSMNVLCR